MTLSAPLGTGAQTISLDLQISLEDYPDVVPVMIPVTAELTNYCDTTSFTLTATTSSIQLAKHVNTSV